MRFTARHGGSTCSPSTSTVSYISLPGLTPLTFSISTNKFLDGPGPARCTGCDSDDPDSELEPFFVTSAAPVAAAFVHSRSQRVKADRLPPSGLLFLLPVQSRRGGCISLDFLGLPGVRSDHDCLQGRIDLLTGRVRPVPALKTAAAEPAARRGFVFTAFRDARPPDALVTDRDARSASAFWACLRGGPRRVARLRLPISSQHHQQGRAR